MKKTICLLGLIFIFTACSSLGDAQISSEEPNGSTQMIPSATFEPTAVPTTTPTNTIPPLPSMTPTLAFLPTGKIFYLSLRRNGQQVSTINADGSGQTSVFFDDDLPVRDIYWSPDGEYFAITSLIIPDGREDASRYLRIIERETGEVIFTESQVSDGSWSPDSTKFAYLHTGNIWIYSLDDNRATQYTNTSEYHLYVAWSPIGNNLLVNGRKDEVGNLYNFDIDSGTFDQITSLDSGIWVNGHWSPDGEKIAYNGTDDQLFVINSDGTGNTQLTEFDVVNFYTRWSPDGSKLCFVSSDDGDMELYMVNVDGTDLEQLTFNDAWDASPSWSPDGEYIVFVSSRNDPSFLDDNLYIMRNDGSGQRAITSDGDAESDTIWYP